MASKMGRRKKTEKIRLKKIMKPNDKNANLPPEQRPFRILIISGSDKRQYEAFKAQLNPFNIRLDKDLSEVIKPK